MTESVYHLDLELSPTCNEIDRETRRLRVSNARPPRTDNMAMDPLTNICANFEQVGRAFAEHYYTVFDSDRSQLGALYKEEVSFMNFEAGMGLHPGRRGVWVSE
jgi:hypothetical protein